MQALQTLFDPAGSLKRVDDFSKWIFASIGVVGSLGAAFSNSAFSSLALCGKDIFGVAVFLAGLSLFAATWTIEPQWVHANTASRESMLAAVDANLRARRRPLQIACGLFSLSLVVAALAPLVSLQCGKDGQVALAYDIKADGKMTGQATAAKLSAFVPIELTIQGTSLPQGGVVPRQRRVTDEKGQASLSIDLPNGRVGNDLKLVVSWADVGNASTMSHTKSLLLGAGTNTH
ncbi:MAG TPA: hypothetical protein VI386_10155 [Candidatus Sulfotelmatobacter sp.]